MDLDRASWRRTAARLGCTPAEALAVAIVLCGAVVGLGLLWWLQRPVAIYDSGGAVTVVAPTTPPEPAATPTTSAVAVHVTGAVSAPGVYELPVGARVVDAVARAGGATAVADLDRVNLALAVADGMQVRVPVPGETLAPSSTATAIGGDAAPLDLNTADATALDQLPGVGPVTAGKIVEHRAAIGRYDSVEQLLEIRGIGESTLADIAPRVTVGG